MNLPADSTEAEQPIQLGGQIQPLRVAAAAAQGDRSQMLSVLVDFLSGQAGACGRWRDWLDAATRRQGGRRLWSTFGARAGADFGWLEDGWLEEGTARVQNHHQYLHFATIAEQRAAIALPVNAPGILLQAIMWINAHVADNFYIRFETADSHDFEAIRITRDAIGLIRAGLRISRDTTVPHLISVAVDRRGIYLYVDGEPACRADFPAAAPAITRVVFELVGESRADLGASLVGFDVAALDQPFSGLWDREEAALSAAADAMAETGDAALISDFLTRFAPLRLTPSIEKLARALDLQIAQPGGVRPWLIEPILNVMPPAARSAWLERSQAAMPRPTVEVSDVAVRFSRNPNTDMSLRRILMGRRRDLFDAVRQVDFKLYPGDILGIIGKNGAGKTTLLKAITGLIPISRGRIRVRGRLDLLRPGIGMRPLMTGRENIRLAALYMGMSRMQIAELADEIIAFSELGDAIDRPIRYYSDGMMSRLMFSIATSLSPDILMLDELLSAGDLQFRQKAEARLETFLGKARTVVVVTHDLSFLRDRCNKGLYMRDGAQAYFGDPRTALSHYLADLHLTPAAIENRSLT